MHYLNFVCCSCNFFFIVLLGYLNCILCAGCLTIAGCWLGIRQLLLLKIKLAWLMHIPYGLTDRIYLFENIFPSSLTVIRLDHGVILHTPKESEMKNRIGGNEANIMLVSIRRNRDTWLWESQMWTYTLTELLPN